MHNELILFVNLHILVYIDPGTGSIILQAVIASVVGAAVAVKLFWHKILRFLGIRKKSDGTGPGTPGEGKGK